MAAKPTEGPRESAEDAGPTVNGIPPGCAVRPPPRLRRYSPTLRVGERMQAYSRFSLSTSTISPAASAGVPAGRRTRASAAAKTLTSEES